MTASRRRTRVGKSVVKSVVFIGDKSAGSCTNVWSTAWD